MIGQKNSLHSRREILQKMLGAGVSLPLLHLWPSIVFAQQNSNVAANTPAGQTLSPEDDQFLNEVEAASFLFFWEQGSPKTGMVKDRCNVNAPRPGDAASIAATGFGLTALCI